MNRENELTEIRKLQQELQGKLDTLNRRIEELEKTPESVSSPEPTPTKPEPAPPLTTAKTDVPPPLPSIPEPQKKAEPVPEPPKPEVVLSKVEPVKAPETSPPAAEASKPRESLELQFGQVWLVRIGIVILLTGLVFLGNLAWKELAAKVGPIGKLGVLYFAGVSVAVIGWLVQRKRAELANYGKVLIGGGIAAIYYTTYAAHFVEPLRVITNPLIGGALLLALAGGIIWLADRMRSQAVAAVTTVLGFYTAAINPIAGFSLFSNLVLSLVAITLLLRRRWASVSFLALAGCYLAYGFWRIHATGTLLPGGCPSPALFWTALLFPACYWVVFTVAVFVGRSWSGIAPMRPVFLTLNNGGFFALAAPVVAGQYDDRLWIFTLAFGVILLALAWVAAKREPGEGAFDGAYLIQGLILILIGLVFKFSGYQLALLLALQTGTLMKLSQLRHGRIFQVFSGLSAFIAMGYAVDGLEKELPHAEIAAGSVAVVLIGTAWLCKRQRGWLNPVVFKKRAAGFVALSTVLALMVIDQTTEDSAKMYTLLALAVAGTASLHLLRMPEVVYGAQVLAGFGFLAWFSEGDFTTPLPNTCALVAALALMHWWQREKPHVVAGWWRRSWESAYALAAVLVVGAWVFVRYQNNEVYLAPALSIAAFVVLAYALFTRAWPLVVCGQILSIWFVARMVMALDDRVPWPVVAGALACFLGQSGILRLLGHRSDHPTLTAWHATAIHAVTVFLTLGTVHVYVPEEWRFVSLSAVAFALCGLGLASASVEALVYAAMLILAGCGYFLKANLDGTAPFAANFLGLSLILFAQQIGRRRLPELVPLARVIQTILIATGVLGSWLLMHRLVAQVDRGWMITISWSLLAFVVLATGFILRERAYRLLGLGLLVISIIRVFTIDVWQLDRLYQVLSILVLAVVVLVLGFLYNRFAHVIRKWI